MVVTMLIEGLTSPRWEYVEGIVSWMMQAKVMREFAPDQKLVEEFGGAFTPVSRRLTGDPNRRDHPVVEVWRESTHPIFDGRIVAPSVVAVEPFRLKPLPAGLRRRRATRKIGHRTHGMIDVPATHELAKIDGLKIERLGREIFRAGFGRFQSGDRPIQIKAFLPGRLSRGSKTKGAVMNTPDGSSRRDTGGVDEKDFTRYQVRDRRRPSRIRTNRLILGDEEAGPRCESTKPRRDTDRRRRSDRHPNAAGRQGSLRLSESFKNEARMTVVGMGMPSTKAGVHDEWTTQPAGGFGGHLEERVLIDSICMVDPADHEIASVTVRGHFAAIDQLMGPLPKVRRQMIKELRGVHDAGTRNAPRPPSMPMVWPVTQSASSERSQAIAGATSSGTPIRPRGCILRECSSARSLPVILEASGVSMSPGATTLNRRPRAA